MLADPAVGTRSVISAVEGRRSEFATLANERIVGAKSNYDRDLRCRGLELV